MTIRRFAITIDSADSPLVERPSPGSAPTAFRIWAAGENLSDDGVTLFTSKSAELLLAEQAARGRVYPSDFDHLSLMSDRPAEAGRASGYHVLEVRESATGPELWATQIEWCVDVRAGLEESPPRWKYFSPAFRQDESGEVTSYVNFAVCINPKTHNLPSLAGIGSESTGETGTMNKQAMRAFLAKMSEAATDESAKMAYATIAAAIGDDEEKKEPEALSEEPAKEPDAEEKKDPEAEKKAECDEPTKKAVDFAMAADLAKANAKIASLEIKGMLDARPDLGDSLKKWAMTQDADTVRSFLSAAPKSSSPRSDRSVAPPEVGTSAIGLQGAELEFMNAQMGITSSLPRRPHRDELGRLIVHTVRPGDMHKLDAQKGKA